MTTLGRPRDAGIDRAVLEATLRQLSIDGLAGLSVAAIAAEAGTTRPAIYRRWSGTLDIVVSAIAHLADTDPPMATGDPLPDLVCELEDFRHCIRAPGAMALAGVMLGSAVDAHLRARYVDVVVGPRRTRIGAILQSGVDQGQLAPDADLPLAMSTLTGSWYAMAVADVTAPADWATRVSRLVWQACGGIAPPAVSAKDAGRV